MCKYIYLLLFLLAPTIANAGAFDLLDSGLKSSVVDVTAGIQSTAIIWLSSFVLIQTVVTNFGLLKSGADIEAIFGKLIGSLMWFGFCFYVLEHGPEFVGNVSKGFFTTASNVAGAGGFDAGLIISKGATIAANLVAQINKASSITNLFLPAILGGIMGVVILATAALIAFKVFLIKIETMLIIMIAPLSFSFMGLNALKDQGIAPFKSLISLIYRVLLLAVLLKTMSIMSDNLVHVIETITADSIDGIWSAVFAAVTGYVLLAFLVLKSDSIASNLASGTTSMGTGDVASAAAMGAAAGAMVATGGASAAAGAAGAAAKPIQSMGDFMKSINGSGSVSNASSTGVGGLSSSLPLSPPPLASMGSGSSGGSAKPAPAFPTNKAGAPMPLGWGANNAGAGSSGSSGAASTSPSFQSGQLGDATPAPGSSGSSANIGGTGSSPTLTKDDLQKAMANQNSGKKTAWDHAATLNQHMAQEKATTGVSINTHHSD